jgi:hypothetical protein
MARRTFFSFHYKEDVQRAYVVRNSQYVKEQGETGFYDSSAFEKQKNQDPDSLKRFLRREVEGSSVVCVLVGSQTAQRRWVRFEILQALMDARGLVGIRVHKIAGWNGMASAPGHDPFDLLGVYREDNRVYLVERATNASQWAYTSDFGKQVLAKWPYSSGQLPPPGTTPLSNYFMVHTWLGDAHNRVGGWLEAAAQQAAR